MKTLRAEHLAKSYNKRAVVIDVSISIDSGQVVGLLGPNGAGKSTFIKMALGHLYPSSGTISVMGEDPKSIKAKEKMGYLPERSYMYKNLTGRETLQYFGEILKLSKSDIQERTEQLLEMAGLAHAGDRLVGTYSHGMTRRIGMAQALLNAPDLIILDEPTAGLDPVGCREVKDLIIELSRQGKTVLITSHILADIQDVCDEVTIMFGGVVQVSGKTETLLSDLHTTKLVFPEVRPEILNAVKELLKADLQVEEIDESSPTQSLEEYFLKVVSERHGHKQKTAGADLGKGVAQFLKKTSTP